MSGFTIRKAGTDDIPAMAGIVVRGMRSAYEGLADPEWLDNLNAPEFEQKWKGWLVEDGVQALIAFPKGEDSPCGLVAFGRVYNMPPGGSPIRPPYPGEIFAIYILPEWFRQGLGARLMREAAKAMLDMGWRGMCLWVHHKNTRAISFYEKLGAQRCGKKDVDIGGRKGREICMGWRDADALLKA